MSLCVFNGSPRGVNSNSSVITSWFLKGYTNEHKIFFLNKVKQHQEIIEHALTFDEYLFVMPLYVDGMPGQVKKFFETIFEHKIHFENKKVTYIIHSGFGEGIQSRSLEKYLYRFSSLMNFNNYGVMILPGSEPFRLMPAKMTQKKCNIVAELAKDYMNNQAYDKKKVEKLIAKERMSFVSIGLFKFFSLIGLSNLYWNSQLKQNKAFEKRYDAPYLKSPFENN